LFFSFVVSYSLLLSFLSRTYVCPCFISFLHCGYLSLFRSGIPFVVLFLFRFGCLCRLFLFSFSFFNYYLPVCLFVFLFLF
jgi:hypothetical protein